MYQASMRDIPLPEFHKFAKQPRRGSFLVKSEKGRLFEQLNCLQKTALAEEH
jgi:hypothetical protein